MGKLKYKNGNTWVTNLSPINIIEGAHTTSNDIQIMNDAVKGYVENVTYTFANENAYTASDYSSSQIGTYVSQATTGGYRGDRPNGQSITLSASGDYNIIDTKPQKSQEIENKSGTFIQYNFTPNSKAMYNHIKNKEIINNGVIYPTGQVRMLYSDTVYGTSFHSGNFRDLGGWTCDGGKLAYGKIIRGTRLNGGSVRCSETDKAMFKNFIGIKSEIDLRSNDEARNKVGSEYIPLTESALGDGVDYLHKPISNYSTGLRESRENYKAVLLKIKDNLEKNKPTYIHCMAGADRTGTTCAILEAICGVSRSDIDKDYEITTFTNFVTGAGTVTTEFERYRNIRTDYKNFISYFFENYTGNSFRDRVIGWCLDIGLNYDDINSIRNGLIDGNPSPIEPPVTMYSIHPTTSHTTLSNTNQVAEGSTYTTNVTADTNYEISSVVVTMNNEEVQGAYDNGVITVQNISGDIYITATATAIPYYDIHTTLSNVSLSDTSSVQRGGTYTSIVVPNTDYIIDSVTVTMNNQEVQNAYDSANNTITVSNVTADIYIVASAIIPVIPTYTITTNLTKVDSDPNAPLTVEEGDSYTNTLTVQAEHVMDSVTVMMGSSDITQTAYTAATGVILIGSVTGNVVITATAKGVNILDTAFTSHGTSYSAVGYEDGKRLSGSTGALTTDEVCFATGFIPIIDGDKMRITGVTIPEASSGDGKQYLGLYKSNKSKVLVITLRLNPDGSPKTFTGAYSIAKDTSSGTTTYTITINLGTYTSGQTSTDTTSATFARIGLIGTGENSYLELNP